MNEILRKKFKELKCFQGVSYIELAEHLDIKKNSFYNWLKGYYDLSPERQERLQEIITLFQEV